MGKSQKKNMRDWFLREKMTKLKIISRLWSHITDLRLLISGAGTKSLERIEEEIDITEYYCRPLADMDDTEGFYED